MYKPLAYRRPVGMMLFERALHVSDVEMLGEVVAWVRVLSGCAKKRHGECRHRCLSCQCVGVDLHGRFQLGFLPHPLLGIVTLILLQTCLMALFKVYRIRLVDSSLELLVRGVGSLVVSGILILVIVLTQIKDFTYSFRLVASYWTNTVLFLMGYRILYRLVNTYHFRGSDRYPKAVVYGAGEIGSQLARMYFKQKLQLSIVGFIDDNPLKIHTMVQGIQVYGTIEQLPETLSETKASVLIIAITDLSSERMKQTLDIASKAGVEVKIVPSLFEMQRPQEFCRFAFHQLQRLVGTFPDNHRPRTDRADGLWQTGPGHRGRGSIGSEISRQLLMYKPEQLLLFDIDETELHDLALRLHGYKAEFSHAIVPIVGDVRNADKVEWTFATYQPELVFHAAPTSMCR
jgi:FlaA1/EpsC-like NDP-sugar epimerase